MDSKKVIGACDFCTSMIKLNIALIADSNRADYISKRKKLIDNIKNKYADLSSMNDKEIQNYLYSVYITRIDNDKYGKNNLSVS